MGNVCNRGLRLKQEGRNCLVQFDVTQLWPAELCWSAGLGSPRAPAVHISKAAINAGRPRTDLPGCVGSTTRAHALSKPLSVLLCGTSPNRQAQQC